VHGNLESGDEIVICNDGSTDDTGTMLEGLQQKFPILKVVKHLRNKGGGAARNTAIENTNNPFLFCLDSDNLLAPGSIKKLKEFMISSGTDVAAFQELHYFMKNIDNITHKWIFNPGMTTLADCLSGSITPIASGNYMFTKDSWCRAGGYPEFAGALDAWGFGFRQLATGSSIAIMPDLHYYHRYGHESYWIRDLKKGKVSLTATQILIPFLDLIDEKDVNFLMGEKGRYTWFKNLKKRHIRLKSGDIGNDGKAVYVNGTPFQNNLSCELSLLGKITTHILRIFQGINKSKNET
jgi:glycosyltransferase involved in cell wall biosynthesis